MVTKSARICGGPARSIGAGARDARGPLHADYEEQCVKGSRAVTAMPLNPTV